MVSQWIRLIECNYFEITMPIITLDSRIACSDTKDIDFLHSIGEHSVGYYLNTQPQTTQIITKPLKEGTIK